jgi:mRNA interferase YafQ
VREIKLTSEFKQDRKRILKRNLDISLIENVVDNLAKDIPLPPLNKDHNLMGNYKGKRECHIQPDWLLIYRKEKDVLILVRTGSHSDLF